MWKIYVILALWTQLLNAQQEIYMSNAQGSSSGKSTAKSTDEFDYIANWGRSINNAVTPAYSHTYNTNSRDPFGSTHLQNINTPIVNKLSRKSSEIETNTEFIPSKLGILTGDSFNAKLFEIMSLNAQNENLVYSPISLQTLLAFIFTMSSGILFEELTKLLDVPNNRMYVENTFEDILQTVSLNTPPTTLIMANKLYYDYRLGPIDEIIHNRAKQSFASELEKIQFSSSTNAAKIINSWINERTHNLIRDIVTPSSISSDTSALLLNSIYFKSEWLVKFATYDTETQNFFVSPQTQVPVDMMHNEDVFRYGDFSNDLQATVVELPYVATNLTMMVILPNEVRGLAQLERKLRYYDLEYVSQKLKREMVTIKLPRFKVEFETDMIRPLQQMGLNALFNNAGSINLFKKQQKPLKVDQFKHKSFINVNEAGTEAAAVSVAKYVPLSLPHNMKYFIANHPFVFVIRDPNITYFVGHVVQL